MTMDPTNILVLCLCAFIVGLIVGIILVRPRSGW